MELEYFHVLHYRLHRFVTATLSSVESFYVQCTMVLYMNYSIATLEKLNYIVDKSHDEIVREGVDVQSREAESS